MIVTINEMKTFLRLDDGEEDALIEHLIYSAEEYVKNATGFKFEQNIPETAKLIVRMLVGHWYDNRVVSVTGKNVNNVGFSVEALLNQLKYSHFEGDV